MLLPRLVFVVFVASAAAFAPRHGFTHHPPVVGRSALQVTPFRRAAKHTRLFSSVEGDFDPEAISRAREEVESGSIKARLRALYKFTRPHTIRGTILASVAGTVRALIDTPGAITNANWSIMLPRAIIGMTALLLGNAFIVGINQIYDESIDKMNKPFLPVASGEMSKRSAWVAVLFSLVTGPALVYKYFPILLFRLYATGIALGAIYSVPPIRTKKNPILAGLTIATVRGFLLNFGVYYAVKDAVGATFSWSPKVAFIARFMVIFASVIAVTKDLPDVEGDKVRVGWLGDRES
jgi:homogentisate solanesyltransferase